MRVTMQELTDTPASALRTAAFRGDREIVQHLIKEGVDVNVWDRHGRTALSLAAGAGHVEIIEHLLDAGAWIDPHEDGDVFPTPLISAAEKGQIEAVELLLKRGANPTHMGGIPIATADFYARCNHPDKEGLSAMLRSAEDAWRRKHRSD
jgi:ankyrin repeat protein